MPTFRPEVGCAILGFFLGMCMSLGPAETVGAGAFVLTKAAAATAWTANWFVEPKYTGQEDLPPGFCGEAPILEARVKDESQPMQCQTVDPSALVCSTVRVSGSNMFNGTGQVFNRRAFDEIQGRAPFVSEGNEFLGFWCEKSASWRLSSMSQEQAARDGSCYALAGSSGGVQFKDASGWVQSDHPRDFEEQPTSGATKPDFLFEISVGDEWVPSTDI